ncbi:MAG: hypothetical protein U0Y82_07145 [Thermoleophilia bacterium]
MRCRLVLCTLVLLALVGAGVAGARPAGAQVAVGTPADRTALAQERAQQTHAVREQIKHAVWTSKTPLTAFVDAIAAIPPPGRAVAGRGHPAGTVAISAVLAAVGGLAALALAFGGVYVYRRTGGQRGHGFRRGMHTVRVATGAGAPVAVTAAFVVGAAVAAAILAFLIVNPGGG